MKYEKANFEHESNISMKNLHFFNQEPYFYNHGAEKISDDFVKKILNIFLNVTANIGLKKTK